MLVPELPPRLRRRRKDKIKEVGRKSFDLISRSRKKNRKGTLSIVRAQRNTHISPRLAPGEIHIWTASNNAATDAWALEETLSPDEQEAARRFHFARHRGAYTFAHAVLRDILSRYRNQAPGRLHFERDSFGKPFLVEEGLRVPPFFNLSHSGSTVLVGLGECHIGVDVEEIRPIEDIESISRAHFTSRECAFVLAPQPADYRERAFFQCWTRKEALIKAVGKGLSIPLNSFDTFITAGQSGRMLPGVPGSAEIESWWLMDLVIPTGYMGALAVENSISRCVYFEWQSPNRG